MLEIPLNFSFPLLTYENSRQVVKKKINDEWSIVFPLNHSSFYCMEIHRKNIAGEFLVSGELEFSVNNRQFPLRKFSQFIKTGSTFTAICLNIPYSYDICFRGVLRISDSNEKMRLKSLEELSSDFEKLLHPVLSCSADVILKCYSVSIPAHKNILSARSPVFAAMFVHPMKENPKNEVDITDIDESTFLALLKYIYTGKTSDLTVASASKLLYAADKYQLQCLKAVCSYNLKKEVSPENVWRILVLGDMYSSDLKTFAVNYICRYCGKFSAVENKQEWQELRKVKPELAMELLESLVKLREEK